MLYPERTWIPTLSNRITFVERYPGGMKAVVHRLVGEILCQLLSIESLLWASCYNLATLDNTRRGIDLAVAQIQN